MGQPYLGEIKVVSFNFAPRGWALCNGQQLPINQNQALFSILGTQYGGNGVTTFALPNLQGRIPLHAGQGFTVGSSGGEAAHPLTINEMPVHNHPARAQSAASSPGTSPAGAVWAAAPQPQYAGSPDTAMSSVAVGTAGGNQSHENRPPFLVLTFIVALQGIFPSAN